MFHDYQIREVEWLLDSELHYLQRKMIFCESWTLVKYPCCSWINKPPNLLSIITTSCCRKKIPFHICKLNLLPKLCR